MQRRSFQNTGRQILPKNSLALNHQQNVGLIEPTQMVQKETEVSLFVSFKFKQKFYFIFNQQDTMVNNQEDLEEITSKIKTIYKNINVYFFK